MMPSYRSKCHSPLEYALPAGDYLIGWYKFDEGSGTVVNNYATGGSDGGGLLPNLNVIGDQDIFWNTLVGFGYSPYWDSGVNPYSYALGSIARSFGNKYGIGVFAKRIEEVSGSLFEFLITEQAGSFSLIIYLTNTYVEIDDNESTNFIFESELNRWYFFFIDDTNLFKLVKDDGTLLTTSDPAMTKSLLLSLIWISLGMQVNTEGTPAVGFGGSIGDCIIYNNKDIPISTPGVGYKPWSQWYDLLRSRYGMAVRSGW